jgi:type 1 glutamine amidotransferase
MIALIGALLFGAGSAADPGLFATELAPGVHALGSSHRFGAANLGWVALEDRILLIGAPDPELVNLGLAEIKKQTEKPIRVAVLTQVRQGEVESARAFIQSGIDVVVQAEGAKILRAALDRMPVPGDPAGHGHIREFADRLELGDGGRKVEVRRLGRVLGPDATIVYLPESRVLFTGGLGVNGPRADLAGADTLGWLGALRTLRALDCRTVVPGHGTIGGPAILERLEKFLRELRRQVGHLVAQGRPLEDVIREVRVTPGYLVWMPYDNPTHEDVEHVYRELTVPLAPFGGRDDPGPGGRPKALVLIADGPHDPEPIEASLTRALERAGVEPYVCVDVRALCAATLKRVQLMVILRDGAIWPSGRAQAAVTWMTPEQERAIVAFVEGGGGLLALHNATGLYPDGGPYLELLGGTYRGHGPLERFRVAVVDRDHPITRGVADFEVADEQHTPIPDRQKVRLLLESRSAEGILGAAGWVRSVGRGRVCYLANGHTREALDHPEYQKLLRNAATWATGRSGKVE